jgi:hypothetical protein
MVMVYPNQFDAFPLDPKGNVLIMAITPITKLPDCVKRVSQRCLKVSVTYTFRMDVSDKMFTSVKEVKSYMRDMMIKYK